MKKLLAALALLFVCSPISAQILSRSRHYEDLGVCNATKQGRVTIITDAASDGQCSGDGTGFATCWCKDGSWVSNPELSAVDLSSYALLAGADFTGPVSVTLGNDDAFVVTGADGATLSVECDEGDCAVGASAFSVADGYFSAAGFNGGAYTQLSASDEYTSIYGNDGAGIESFLQIDSATGVMTLYSDAPLTIKGCTFHGTLSDYSGIATPTECDTFFDLTLHVPCFYNGSNWLSVTDGTTGCTATPPE